VLLCILLFCFSICSSLLTLFAEKIWGDNPYNKLHKESLSVSPTPRARETTLQRKQGKSLGQSNTESQGDNPAEKTRKISRLVQHREPRRQPWRENKESLSVSPTPRDRETTLHKKNKESLSVSPTPRARETTLQKKQGKSLS
jgi:hypothetical protein